MEPLQYQGGPFDTTVERVDDKVTFKVWSKGSVIVEMDMTRKGAVLLVQKIMGVLY